ncbi:hypothetical protein ACE0DR_28595, partial [Azotobacter sp. CWF10]
AAVRGRWTGRDRLGDGGGSDRGTPALLRVPQYRDMASKAFDLLLAARSALYGYPTQLPSAENISRQYFTGYMEVEEIPA